MTDDPGKIPLEDRRVTLDDMHNVRAWMSYLDCDEAELRLAVRKVGDRVADVRAFLVEIAEAIAKPSGSDGSNGLPRRLKRNFQTPVRPQATAKAIEIEKANRLKASARLVGPPPSADVGNVGGVSVVAAANIPVPTDENPPCPTDPSPPSTKPRPA